jgi:hypothetical protein
MEITIISPLGDDLQVWTLYMTESEFSETFEKFAARGCSVLTDRDQVAEEIGEIYK